MMAIEITARERLVDEAVRRVRNKLPWRVTAIDSVRAYPGMTAQALWDAWPAFCTEVRKEFRHLQERERTSAAKAAEKYLNEGMWRCS